MKPLILDHAIQRKDTEESYFIYDYSMSLNVVNLDGRTIPFIALNNTEIQLLTKTKVKRESDDEDINVLELDTKTEKSRERDDIDNSLVELFTKTFVDKEKDDDESFINY